jgi:HEAT repeat protein
VAEVERGDVELLDRPGLLRRLALSPSRSVRIRVAEAAAALSSENTEAGLSLLRQLSHDATGAVRAAAARGLAQFMQHAPGPLRCAVESAWATAEAPDERVALARALGMAAPDWLTDFALVELAADARAPVRRAAVQAAGIQLGQNPETYVRLAAARSGDPDRRVRKLARHALRRAEATGWLAALRPSPLAMRESRKRFRRAMRDRDPYLAQSLEV